MEDNLDLIAKENKIWYTLCETCNGAIDVLSSKISLKSRVKPYVLMIIIYI